MADSSGSNMVTIARFSDALELGIEKKTNAAIERITRVRTISFVCFRTGQLYPI
jgi:hypothetical protein